MSGSSLKVVVVGGGIMGLGCALRLADAGTQVHVLESRQPGQGATLAALGALWPASPLAQGPLQELHRASLWEFESLVAQLTQRTGMPVLFRRLGRLELLNSPKAAARAAEEAQAACATWPAFGNPVMQVLSPKEIAVRWPALAPAEYAGLHCRATAQVRVDTLMQALTRACEQAGVQISTGTAVQGLLKHAGDRVRGVMTVPRPVEGDAVLVTAGAWAASIADEVAAAAPIRPAKGQGLALAMPANAGLELIVKRDSVYLIPWQRESESEVLVGSTTEPEAGFDESPTADARHLLSAGAGAILPTLAGAPILRHWAGLRPQNPAKRHPPIMGPHPRLSGLWICTGHFKTGIGLMPAVSRGMARWMLEGHAEALSGFEPKA